MIVRITGISIDDSPLSFEPFLTEIPDREVGWDRGHEYMETFVCDQDDFLVQFNSQKYNKFSYDYDLVELSQLTNELVRY